MKKYSLKFWVIFWTISALFLTGWFFFWQVKNRNFQAVESVASWLPIGEENREKLGALAGFGEYLFKKDGQEKTFLILFQNNMEIRPGGGYIGSFGILKVKDGRVTLLQTHDLSNFDGRVPDGIPVPYPMWETLRVKDWKMRDSNWSPDWAENARKAEYFYYLGKGEEKFDGVIGITSNVLVSFLKVTGPVKLEGYDQEFGDENAILTLEYQVEQGYINQGIALGERKSIMNQLAKAVIEKAEALSPAKKLELAQVILEDLKQKDIQLFFHDEKLQSDARQAGWSGEIDQNWSGNFLALSDANLGAYKSDYYMRRSVEYSVDHSKARPEAVLKVTYRHTGQKRDWMTKDYVDYLRIYVPNGSWLENGSDFGQVVFGEDLGKKYFATLIHVPLDAEKTFEFRFTLPENLKDQPLLIQKQAGINGVPYAVRVIDAEGKMTETSFMLDSDRTVQG